MGFFRRIFGICRTPQLTDRVAWRFESGVLELDVAKVPSLRVDGSAVRLEDGVLPCRVLVVRGIDGRLRAYENRCTHMGRRIDPLGAKPHLQCCSVGKSEWDYEGHVVGGSAKEDLRRFPAEQEGDTLRIDLTPEA